MITAGLDRKLYQFNFECRYGQSGNFIYVDNQKFELKNPYTRFKGSLIKFFNELEAREINLSPSEILLSVHDVEEGLPEKKVFGVSLNQKEDSYYQARISFFRFLNRVKDADKSFIQPNETFNFVLSVD